MKTFFWIQHHSEWYVWFYKIIIVKNYLKKNKNWLLFDVFSFLCGKHKSCMLTKQVRFLALDTDDKLSLGSTSLLIKSLNSGECVLSWCGM